MNPSEIDPHEMRLLNQALGEFSMAADVLGGFYQRLTQEIANLNQELERKTSALAESLSRQARTRDFLAVVLDSLNTGVMVLEESRRVVLTNQAARDLLGLASDRILNASLTDLLPIPDGQGWSATEMDRIVSDGQGREITICRDTDGRIISCALSPFVWPGETRPGLIALLRDVTDQTLLGIQRERSQALAAMGLMAAEIAHQIRNPLGGIELFASILGREVADDENQTRLVGHILGGVNEVNHLVSNYLTLSRPPHPVKAAVRLDQLIEEAIEASRQALETKRIQVRFQASERPVLVEGDAQLLLQVLLNLVLNAIEAMDGGGALDLDVRHEGTRVEARISDTGVGIPREDLDRIFHPFFTTKEKSLGLGLAVSHMVIDAHQGLIQVTSHPGRGTTVALTLPLWVKGETQGPELRSE